MKYCTILLLLPLFVFGQNEYEANNENPFGSPNPSAPEQIKDFAPLIGICDCSSVARAADGSWAAPVSMTWKFRYIMNGTAIQDETLKADGIHSGSIRQYNKDSAKWYVHYYTTKGVPSVLPAWEGKKENDKIVLYKEQNAPNGAEGSYRLTFYEMSEKGYKWIGEWVSKDKSVTYPTWKIDCTRIKADR